MHADIRESLVNVYDVFKYYTLKNPKDVGCFDMGPSDQELEGISKKLKDIPDEIVRSMEFFGEGWDSWGSQEDVKYFLPRIFEYVANDIGRLNDPGTFSFFKYKLVKCLQPENKDWTESEKQAIENFFSRLLIFHFSSTKEIADLVEAALAVGISPESLHVFWEQNTIDRSEKIKYLEKEYGTSWIEGRFAPIAGVDLFLIARLLGHSVQKTTELYAHLHPNYLRGAVSVLSAATPKMRLYQAE